MARVQGRAGVWASMLAVASGALVASAQTPPVASPAPAAAAPEAAPAPPGAPTDPASEPTLDEAPAPPAPEEAYLHPARGRVPLRIETPGPSLRLTTMTPTEEFADLCATPCTIYVPPGRFVFDAEGPQGEEPTGSSYRVEVPRAGLRVQMAPASPGAALAGKILLGVGVAALLGGLLALPSLEADTPLSAHEGAAVGIALGSGAALIGVGLALGLTLGRTRIGARELYVVAAGHAGR